MQTPSWKQYDGGQSIGTSFSDSVESSLVTTEGAMTDSETI